MLKILLIILLLPLSSYSLPKCEGDDVSIWNNCLGTETYTDGWSYIGEFKDDKKNGQGKNGHFI